MDSHEAPVDLCPHCGYSTNRTSPLTGARGPKPQDFTICLNCGEFLQFDDNLRMVKTTDADMEAAINPTHMMMVRKAQNWIKARGKIEKRNVPN